MADTVVPISLNIGLDTITPPLMAEAGSLISCLNYELTDTVGYRRIDGYERYDGFPNGNIFEYFRIGLTATDPLEQALLVPGTVIYRSDFGNNPVAIGVIAGGPFDSNYDIVPLRPQDSFILIEEFLVQSNGIDYIQLESNQGLLRILGEGSVLGSTFTGYSPNGEEIDLSISGTLQEGGTLVPVKEYLDNLRAYSSALRGEVISAPAPIAGIYWFNDRLLAAVNALEVTLLQPAADPTPKEGRLFEWNGTRYRLLKVTLTDEDVDNTYILSLMPIGDATTTSDDLVEVGFDGVAIQTWQSGTSGSGNPNSDNSKVAYMGYFKNYNISTTRGFVPLPSAYDVNYDAGNYSSAFGPPITFDENSVYYAVGVDGTVLKTRLTNLVQTEGTFSDGSSSGRVQFIVTEVVAGTRDYIMDNDEIHIEYPTTVDSRVLTVSEPSDPSYVAGTGALDINNTKYQWISANFYGRTEGDAAYGATGASAAFWANTHGYGIITTGVDEALDTPKYLAFHAGKLALGYARGSVILSVAGSPYNYNGEDGALEFATGDRITGLLEMPGETLAVFGLRSVRKITGTTDTDTRLGTISGSSGCFDYTAVLVGQDAVFTGVSGISTLQQTAAYGDFAGTRLSDRVANWLRPKLVAGFESFQRPGIILAYPVRNKNQYRLVLSTGETVILTVTSEGPKITLLNHGLIGETKVPYSWSSNTDINGQERIHVTWEERNKTSQVIELESGWGFDGRTFRHFFDTAYLFNANGSMYSGIEKVRLFGQGYGVATLDVKSSGIEDDFQQPYHNRIQDISLPRVIENIYDNMKPVTNIVDQANWGLGIKLRFAGTQNEGSEATEPPHICQALVLHVRTNGALDS